jgi:hypothetical protein
MTEKEEVEREIQKLKQNMKDYLEFFPVLGVSEEEKERIINQFLDDILKRKEKLKKLKF